MLPAWRRDERIALLLAASTAREPAVPYDDARPAGGGRPPGRGARPRRSACAACRGPGHRSRRSSPPCAPPPPRPPGATAAALRLPGMAGELPTNARDRGPAPADRRPARDGGRRPPPRAGLPPRRGAHPLDHRLGGGDGAGRAGPSTCPTSATTLQAKIVELAETGDIAALAEAARPHPGGPGRRRAPRRHRPQARRRRSGRQLGVTGVDDLAAAARGGPPAGGRRRSARAPRQRSPSSSPRRGGGAADERGARPAGPRPAPRRGARAPTCAPPCPGRASRSPAACGAAARRRTTSTWSPRPSGPRELQDALAALPSVQRVLSRGDAAVSVAHPRRACGVELAVGPPASFGNLLQHATGSAAHNIRLRELAVRRGLSVSQHGIAGPGRHRATHADEEGVYAALGLHPIPPELREDRGEIEAARRPARCPALVTRADLRGDLHSHTRWSDGTRRVAAMVEAARARGYAYLAISDHSQSLAMAGGLDPDRVRRQWEEIARDDARHDDIAVLKATEVDILADGRIDFDDELLAGFDWVTASMHSALTPGRRAHHRAGARRRREPLRRRDRPPHRPDAGPPRPRRGRPRAASPRPRRGPAPTWRSTAQPRRLDLDAGMARRALAAGRALTIGSDAHSDEALDFIRFGVLVARRAGARPEDVGQHPRLGRAGGGPRRAPRRRRGRRRAQSEPGGAAPRARPAGPAPPRRPPRAPRPAPRRWPPRRRPRRRGRPSSRIARRARQASASVRSSPM